MSPDEAFFARPALDVAPYLLGRHLTHRTAAGAVSVRLTEVEAYAGAEDPGSHAFRGRTPRTAVMFGPPGRLYVYFTYGMHWCANLVCGPDGTASAVLLRAGEVVAGHELARARRPSARSDRDLARGPARLTTAMGLDGTHNGSPVAILEPGVVVVPEGVQVSADRVAGSVRTGPRVGVSGPGGDAGGFPWRFWLDGEPTVSAYRAGVVRPKPRRAAGGGSGTIGADGPGETRAVEARGRP